MKILLLEEMWLDGIESLQYFPSIGEAIESPSYKVKESQLKILNIMLSFVPKKQKNKRNSPATIMRFNIKIKEADFDKLTKGSLNEPSQIKVVVIIPRKSR